MQPRSEHSFNLNNQLHHPGLDVYGTLRREPLLHACLQSLLASRPWLAILDSGCTSHYLRTDAPVLNHRRASPPHVVRLPDGGSIQSQTVADLPIASLPKPAQHAHLFDGLRMFSLLSVGQLCDAGCLLSFTDSLALVVFRDVPIMVAARDPTTKMYVLDLRSPTAPPRARDCLPAPGTHISAHASAYSMRTKSDLAAWHHQSCWAPVHTTFSAAASAGYLASFPGLSPDLITRHLAPIPATAQGHMRMSRQGVRSTRQPHTASPVSAPSPASMTAPTGARAPHAADTHGDSYDLTVRLLDADRISADITGAFPVTSSRGNKYFLVIHAHHPNAICAYPIPNRKQETLLDAYQSLFAYLTRRGFAPTSLRCDNECSSLLRDFFLDRGVTVQFVPPYDHRTNPAEHAIDVFKSHFIAGLALLPDDFPLHLWCRLTPHALLTLNLMRPSRRNPRLSAHADLDGPFDYNAHPLAPPGCRAIAYEAADQRQTWGPKGIRAFYLGPAMEHYRCSRVWIPSTRSERVVKTIRFFPHLCAIPTVSPADEATRAARILADELRRLRAHDASPFPEPSDPRYAALARLSAIFSKMQVPSPPEEQRVAAPEQRVAAPEQRVATPGPGGFSPPSPPACPDSDTHQSSSSGGVLIAHPRHRYPLRSLVSMPPHAGFALNEPTLAKGPILDPITKKPLSYGALLKTKDRAVWVNAYANDLYRLAQGSPDGTPGNDTIRFIPRSAVPPGASITYGRKVCTVRPGKDEPFRVRLTVCGNLLDYYGDASSTAASLTTFKTLLNSVVSTPNARFSGIDIKDFYYGTPLARPEYMRLPLREIPPAVVQHYNLRALASDGWVYIRIEKGMPGLKQAGRIANDRLKAHLAGFGYHPVRHTPSLWVHDSNSISFTLVVDDFGVKYTNPQDFGHLVRALRSLYTITVDRPGTKYLGLHLDWDYSARRVRITMPDYVRRTLERFRHVLSRARNTPAPCVPRTYGSGIQYAPAEDDSDSLPPKEKALIPQVVGTLHYYALALDLSILVALSDIAASQASPTQRTKAKVQHLLDYLATHPDAGITYRASGMVLTTESDASYLSAPKARSRLAGIYYFSELPRRDNDGALTVPRRNGVVQVLSKISRHVLSSAMEAEVGAAFETAREACPLRVTCAEMGHPQPPTPLFVDNAAAVGFATSTTKIKRSKAIDMRYHWLSDRVSQRQFEVSWVPGENQFADYVSKLHPAGHHQEMRERFFTTEHLANHLISLLLKGCSNAPAHARAARASEQEQRPHRVIGEAN